MRLFIAAYLTLLATLAGLAAGGGVVLYSASGPSDAIEAVAEEHAYSIVSWEVRHLPGKWLYKIRHAFGGSDRRDEQESVRRYFTLVEEIARLQRDSNARAELDDAETERAGLENEVEEMIEGRLTDLFKDQGLVLNPPLFSDLGLVFPPVDFEFDSPPRILAVSPRERIELDRSYLLQPGLDLETVRSIERDAEASNAADGSGVSALVIAAGGVATYPSVISALAGHDDLIETAIHEWLHQYLVFFPLGRSYFASRETRTLNESVASIAGRELARLYFERYPQLDAAPASPARPSPSPSSFDLTAELRGLRRQIEGLLSQGRIVEAEALMNRKRDEFEAQGHYIRRLNQAYFAWHGTYADRPASIDPIGPKLQALLQRAGSPGEFVRLASRITSEAALDQLLARGRS